MENSKISWKLTKSHENFQNVMEINKISWKLTKSQEINKMSWS